MSYQGSTPLADLLAAGVRCVRSYAPVPVPFFIDPVQKAKDFAHSHPQEAEKMVAELYVLMHAYFVGRQPH